MLTRKIHMSDNGMPINRPFHYQTVFVNLKYLEKSSRPYFLFVLHQLARISTSQKASHWIADKHFGRYLLGLHHKKVTLQSSSQLELTYFVYESFCGA
jgi:hypothetical protein